MLIFCGLYSANRFFLWYNKTIERGGNLIKNAEKEKVMKYQVWAVQFDREAGAQREFMIGEFNTYMNAKLFRDAYNAHYSANARIQEIATR